VSSLTSRRRRLEANYHHPQAAAILRQFKKLNLTTEPVSEVAERVWRMTRFKRIFGDDGIPYMSADDLFSLNPTVTKRVQFATRQKQPENPLSMRVLSIAPAPARMLKR
jgi:hypothetical protein